MVFILYRLCFCLQDSEKYVEELLTLFNRFSKLVKEAFNDDPRFLTARDKVCEWEKLAAQETFWRDQNFSIESVLYGVENVCLSQLGPGFDSCSKGFLVF